MMFSLQNILFHLEIVHNLKSVLIYDYDDVTWALRHMNLVTWLFIKHFFQESNNNIA